MDILKDITFDRGTETHTFTAIGRCPRSGRLGVSVTTIERDVRLVACLRLKTERAEPFDRESPQYRDV